MTLSDFAKYLMTQSVVRSLCDSRASSLLYFFLCTQNLSTDLALRPLKKVSTCDTPTDGRRVVPFHGQNTVFSHVHPKMPKPQFGGWYKWKAYGKHISIAQYCMQCSIKL